MTRDRHRQLLYTGSLDQLGTQALGLLAVGAVTFSASFLALWAMKRTFGMRTDPGVEPLASISPSTECGSNVGLPRILYPCSGRLWDRGAGHLRLGQPASATPATVRAAALPEVS